VLPPAAALRHQAGQAAGQVPADRAGGQPGTAAAAAWSSWGFSLGLGENGNEN
jgi:hypothetical protein